MEENYKSSREHEFKVVFKGLDLPPEKIKEIEKQIRKTALEAIATIDLQKSCRITKITNGSTDGITLEANEF